jgi:hypothetical protein
MFMVTLNRTGLRRAGAVVLCGVVLAGAVLAGRFSRAAVTAGAAAGAAPAKIESTQDIAAYFSGFGLEVDPAAITADKVKVPKKWDDSFSAFNEVVAQSGLELTKLKGKTVEKWLAELPALSTGEQTVYGVLLVYNQKAVGAYLLEKPSGNVTGLADAVKTMAGQAASTVSAGDSAAASQVSADPDYSQEAALDVDLTAGSDGYPVE